MKIIRLKNVLEQTGLGRSTLYKLVAAGAFPAQVSLGNSRSVGWVAEEVECWVQARIDERDTPTLVRSAYQPSLALLGH